MSATAALADAVDLAGLRVALQPIVALHDEGVFAYEALTRASGGVDTAQLFDRASARGSVMLNLIAIRNALHAARSLPPHALLFVNADPIALASAQLPSVMQQGTLPLSRVVVEITERSPLVDLRATARVLDELRASGVRFALDDFASAHSHLACLDLIRPSFLKIGHGFGSAFEESASRTAIVRHTAALARDLRCSTILEGVESPSTAVAGREMGIEYAQGYHFGRPVVLLERER